MATNRVWVGGLTNIRRPVLASWQALDIHADTSVLERKPSSATYEGLPAQQFVAVASGRTVLVPTGPCPTPACSNVAVFPADLAITVSK
ncbi:MAG TPA: hypothetical protein VNU19_01330 [Candidatus Acidoferrum sp.]|jgi:hypothetical protein|nr:hypothetical protein [Candidatus Acidoferrum sp.]